MLRGGFKSFRLYGRLAIVAWEIVRKIPAVLYGLFFLSVHLFSDFRKSLKLPRRDKRCSDIVVVHDEKSLAAGLVSSLIFCL
jgi:hypothetical protein